MENILITLLTQFISLWMLLILIYETWRLFRAYRSVSQPPKFLSREITPFEVVPPLLTDLAQQATDLGFIEQHISHTKFQIPSQKVPVEVKVSCYSTIDNMTTLYLQLDMDGQHPHASVETIFSDYSLIITHYPIGSSVESSHLVSHYATQSLKTMVDYQLKRVAEWSLIHGAPVPHDSMEKEVREKYGEKNFLLEMASIRRQVLKLIVVTLLGLAITFIGVVMLYSTEQTVLNNLVFGLLPIFISIIGRRLVYHPRFFTKPQPIDAPAS